MSEASAPLSLATDDAGPVTVVVSRTARAGQERAFEEWICGVGAAARSFAGHLGLTVLRGDPASGARDHTLVFRFATVAQLHAWEASAERVEWLRRAEPLVERSTRHQATGLETWFTLPGGAVVVPPPRWKMALVSWAVAFPLMQVLGLTLGPLLTPLPALLRNAFLGGAMVAAMTWWFMPLATRLASRWLYPGR